MIRIMNLVAIMTLTACQGNLVGDADYGVCTVMVEDGDEYSTDQVEALDADCDNVADRQQAGLIHNSLTNDVGAVYSALLVDAKLTAGPGALTATSNLAGELEMVGVVHDGKSWTGVTGFPFPASGWEAHVVTLRRDGQSVDLSTVTEDFVMADGRACIIAHADGTLSGPDGAMTCAATGGFGAAGDDPTEPDPGHGGGVDPDDPYDDLNEDAVTEREEICLVLEDTYDEIRAMGISWDLDTEGYVDWQWADPAEQVQNYAAICHNTDRCCFDLEVPQTGKPTLQVNCDIDDSRWAPGTADDNNGWCVVNDGDGGFHSRMAVEWRGQTWSADDLLLLRQNTWPYSPSQPNDVPHGRPGMPDGADGWVFDWSE